MKRIVLFVDDEPALLEGVGRALRKEPYEIFTADTTEKAFAILDSKPVDVLISDERMPKMSGSEFLSIVRIKYPSTVRMMLTGQATLEAAVAAINEGEIYRMLTKPQSPVDLAQSIRNAIRFKMLQETSARLLLAARRHVELIDALEQQHPGITNVSRADGGAVVIEDTDYDVETLIKEMETSLSRLEGKK